MVRKKLLLYLIGILRVYIPVKRITPIDKKKLLKVAKDILGKFPNYGLITERDIEEKYSTLYAISRLTVTTPNMLNGSGS